MTLHLPEKKMQIPPILEVNNLRQMPGKHIKSETSPSTVSSLQPRQRFPSLESKFIT